MTSEEMHLRIWKLATAGIVAVAGIIALNSMVSGFHRDATSITLRQLDGTEAVRLTAQARAEEARALADRAMFESQKPK